MRISSVGCFQLVLSIGSIARGSAPLTTGRSDKHALAWGSIIIFAARTCRMNFSLSQAVDRSPDVGVSQVSVQSVHPCIARFYCLEETDSLMRLVPRLSTVSRFRCLVPHQPKVFLLAAFWVDHLALEIQLVHLVQQRTSWAPIPIPQVELVVSPTMSRKFVWTSVG